MSTTTATFQRTRESWLARVCDYVELSKPRITISVLFTVAVAYRAACWGQPDPLTMLCVLAGTVLVAASASAMNQWLEWQRDALMARTANRPLPAVRLSIKEAIVFAAVTAIAGAGCLSIAVGWQPAVWAGVTWLSYVCVYTPLKYHTWLNTSVGAVAGAMPVLIGWTAGASPCDLRLAALYLVLFFWQFPHFMSIAWLYRRQYATAGMRMLTVVDPTGHRAGNHAVLAAAAIIPLSLIPALHIPGWWAGLYGVTACALGCAQLVRAVAFRHELTEQAARRLLRATLVYLPVLLLVLLLVPWS